MKPRTEPQSSSLYSEPFFLQGLGTSLELLGLCPWLVLKLLLFLWHLEPHKGKVVGVAGLPFHKSLPLCTELLSNTGTGFKERAGSVCWALTVIPVLCWVSEATREGAMAFAVRRTNGFLRIERISCWRFWMNVLKVPCRSHDRGICVSLATLTCFPVFVHIWEQHWHSLYFVPRTSDPYLDSPSYPHFVAVQPIYLLSLVSLVLSTFVSGLTLLLTPWLRGCVAASLQFYHIIHKAGAFFAQWVLWYYFPPGNQVHGDWSNFWYPNGKLNPNVTILWWNCSLRK